MSLFDGALGPRRKKPLAREAELLRRDLWLVHTDAVIVSVTVALGETLFGAFALALGLGDRVAGLVASVPLLAGAILQLVSPYAIRRLGSHRRWVVLCAQLQALAFAPLVAAALVGRLSALALLAIAAFYWATGMASGAAWNTWVGTIVPRAVRTRFFARRTRLAQVALLVGMLAGGEILRFADEHGRELGAFALLFAFAGAARALSSELLARQSEPNPRVERSTTGLDLHPPTGGVGNRRMLAFMLASTTAVHVSAPFFTPYMLSEHALGLSYRGYVGLIAASFVAKIVTLPALGHYAARAGARRLLRIAGVCVVPLPALWTFSNDYGFLLLIQLFSGTAWGAYELATFLLFFEAIRPEERTRVLTWFNLGNALAMVSGAMLGAFLLGRAGENVAGYAVLFFTSAGLRVLALPLLAWLPDLRSGAPPLATRIVAARPSAGSIERPVFADRPDHPGEPDDAPTPSA